MIRMAYQVILLLLLFFPLLVSAEDEHTCSIQSTGTDCSKEASDNQHDTEMPVHKYTKESNEHWSQLQLIHEAQKEYQPCPTNCSCHYPQIIADLKPFISSGITAVMIEQTRAKGTLYQVLDGKVYREETCMFPSRCLGIEHFLLQNVDKLPNSEFVINVRDWPQVNVHGPGAGSAQLPVFSFSKQEGMQGDILYPAWSFWEGGPAIGLHPTGLGRWDIRRKTIIKSSNKYKWSKKLDKAFFRGSRTTSDRDGIVLLSRENPELADAQYTKNQAWKSDTDTLNATPAKEVTLENHCQYKYLFNFHGVAASFRFKHLFLCGSVVFHEADGWIEFFYPQMKPWIHYIPVPPRPSKEEIKELVMFAQDHDQEVRKIARKGRDFVTERLRMTDVNCYWKKLIKTYTKLLRYEPKLRDDVKLVTGKKR